MAAADINGPGVEALRTDLAADGRSVTVVGGDVCDPDGNRAMVAAAVEAYGRLDVAVAGAGVLPLSDVREYAIEALTAQRVLDLGCGRAGPPGGVRAASRREYLAEVTGADAMGPARRAGGGGPGRRLPRLGRGVVRDGGMVLAVDGGCLAR
ncbi:SDR family NAD(P)-dependent oxidoreductase [Streptomyces sp. IMTB 1903]|uniref:SDR family NAD(P)-dependent oxidoreductase n=1 Tax=Streptomyces sp. IMTB 1903 TaxID=1776680 RepID=UPI00075445B6|nr:SDR family NAD(P)-dependent oxidoreductase [Streptomyces sp. IMTB 1903]